MDEAPTTIDGETLLAGSAALQWHEVVAVVLQLADAVKRAGASAAPDLSHIRLSADGSIAILPGSALSNDPMKQVAATAKLLLERAPAPPELAQFIKQAAEGSLADHDLDRFVMSLSYFERPGRQSVLRSLVERLAAIDAEARVARELERLQAKAREAASAPPAAKTEPVPGSRRRKLAITVLAVVTTIVAGSALAWWQFRPALTAAGSGVSSVVTRTTHGIARTFNKGVDRLFGDRVPEQPPAVSAAPKPPKPAPRTRTRKAKTSDITDRVDTTTASAIESPLLPALILPPAVLTAPDAIYLDLPTDATLVVEAEPADRIYSALDRDITPPVPLQPLLGRPTTDASGASGDMEVLVDRTGAVERVTLLTPNGYQDKMLVYAMKARKFQPAMNHGYPVRYLLRIRTAF